MSFWKFTHGQPHAIAVIDEFEREITYSELDSRINEAAEFLNRNGKRLFCFLFCSNRLASLVAYLACLRAGHVPLLLPENLSPDLIKNLIDHYQPDFIFGLSDCSEVLPSSGISIIRHLSASNSIKTQLHPDLALLLSTSGTTGSPKLVRLSYQALQANAESIKNYLELYEDDRAMTTLPPYYSYGLSVINSHLEAGACLVLGDVSVMTRDFGDLLRDQSVTSIAGVPYIYQMLQRTGFAKLNVPSLRTLTQAGGRLDDRLTRTFHELAAQRGWRFFVMYGQTEATARISYVPYKRLGEKIGSIGVAIPGGKLSLDPDTAEIIYHGDNVMMGYATTRAELALADEMHQTLRTGDLGRVDGDGFFYVTGRLKRFIKLTGNRIGLDEVEQMLQDSLGHPVSVGGNDQCLIAWVEANDDSYIEQAKRLIHERYNVHHSLCRISVVDQLPLLPTGKKDYAALTDRP